MVRLQKKMSSKEVSFVFAVTTSQKDKKNFSGVYI